MLQRLSEPVRLPRRSPNLNAFIERFIRSIKEDCLDRVIPLGEATLAVNRIASETPGRQVCAVGQIRAEPGAPNVIPGKVVMSLEIRDLSAEKIQVLFEEIRQEAAAIADRTGTEIRFEPIDVTAVPALRTSACARSSPRPPRDSACATSSCPAAPAMTPRTWRASPRRG